MSQLSALPLQQQIVLKKVLAPSIPDIDHQVALAGRNDWSRCVHAHGHCTSRKTFFSIITVISEDSRVACYF
jgi:hypothetical protein